MTNSDYVTELADQLADQLTARHRDLLTADNDVALLRARLALAPVHDSTARRSLACALGLHAPDPEKPRA